MCIRDSIEKVRTAVKRVGPDKFLLGEVWEDATTKFGFDKRRTYPVSYTHLPRRRRRLPCRGRA